MSRRYTAQEMRVRADYEESANANAKTAAMLRQAADDMEREEKYEYGVDYANKINGNVCSNHNHFDSLQQAKRYATPLPDEEVRFVRRSVGEWEEVPNAEV